MKCNATYRLGDLLHAFYEEFRSVYRGDRELARMATLATLNELLLASHDGNRRGRRKTVRVPQSAVTTA